jgi:CRISPR-associated protein Cmr5
VGRPDSASYATFAKSFPALIQAAGLCQAAAFAEAKNPALLGDLERILELERGQLAELSRRAPLPRYQRLSRDVIAAAGWLKRYGELLLEQSVNS